MQKIINITDNEYRIIENIIYSEGLSYYKINIDDFICYKEDNKIIAFWRIINIWEENYELSSVWVDINYRWKKLWIDIINDLIKNKFDSDNNLFLACKRELSSYYKIVWFEIIKEKIPEKFEETMEWWEVNGFEVVVMKYYYK